MLIRCTPHDVHKPICRNLFVVYLQSVIFSHNMHLTFPIWNDLLISLNLRPNSFNLQVMKSHNISSTKNPAHRYSNPTAEYRHEQWHSHISKTEVVHPHSLPSFPFPGGDDSTLQISKNNKMTLIHQLCSL